MGTSGSPAIVQDLAMDGNKRRPGHIPARPTPICPTRNLTECAGNVAPARPHIRPRPDLDDVAAWQRHADNAEVHGSGHGEGGNEQVRLLLAHLLAGGVAQIVGLRLSCIIIRLQLPVVQAQQACRRKERRLVILPKVRDPRFITIRRGGLLTDADHRLLALWAADCAEHVLPLFELAQPGDPRPRHAIALARAWVRGEITMTESRTAAGHANAAARPLAGAARHAAYAAAQAAAVAHVAAHELGAAAYAIKAVRAAAPVGEQESAGRRECQWQRVQLPAAIRALILDDQRLRNDICWSVFDC